MNGTLAFDRDNDPIEKRPTLLGGKWRLMVLFRLAQGPVRFNALVRSLTPVSRRVLTVTRRALEDDGLIRRRVNRGLIAHVNHALTARGVALGPVFEAMARWHLQGVSLSPPSEAPILPDQDVVASTW